MAGALLLLTGTCGSGKSTIAQLLADRHGWTRLSEDDVWRARFHRNRGALGSAEHLAKRRSVRSEVCERIAAALAGRTRRAVQPAAGPAPGQIQTVAHVVLDATVHEATPDSLGEYADWFAGAGIAWQLRVLHPRLEVAIARDAARPDWSAGAAGVAALWRKFTGLRFPPHVFLDTSADTPEESALRVLASLKPGALTGQLRRHRAARHRR